MYTRFLSVGGVDFDVFCKLYESLVEPVLLYGAGLWGLRERKKLNTVQNMTCRYFLGLCKNAANIASQCDMGWSSCSVKQKIEAGRLYFKLERTDENRLVKKTFNWSSTHGKSWERRFQVLMRNIGLDDLLNRRDLSPKNKVKSLKYKLKLLDSENWKSKLWDDTSQENGNKLRTYRLYKTDLITEDYVKLRMERSHRRILAKYRSGSFPLQIETGRFTKPKVPLNNRICKLCTDNVVEDEMHFLLCCDFYSDLRRPLVAKAQLRNSNFQEMSLPGSFLS